MLHWAVTPVSLEGQNPVCRPMCAVCIFSCARVRCSFVVCVVCISRVLVCVARVLCACRPVCCVRLLGLPCGLLACCVCVFCSTVFTSTLRSKRSKGSARSARSNEVS